MTFSEVAPFLALTPRNFGIALIQSYRKVVSPLYGDVCRYHPSCSAYGLAQVQQRGLIVGSALAVARILRCNPFSRGGLDNVQLRNTWFQVNRFGFAEPKKKKGI